MMYDITELVKHNTVSFHRATAAKAKRKLSCAASGLCSSIARVLVCQPTLCKVVV